MSFTFSPTPQPQRHHWPRGKQRHPRYWTAAEADLIADYYGVWPDAQIAGRVGRSVTAVRVKAKRMGIGRRDAFLTAGQVAEILGVESHTPPRWAAKGLLPMRRTKTLCAHASAYLWACQVEDIERFLVGHPEAYDWRRVQGEPWREMARQAHAKADYLQVEQVAELMDVTRSCVEQHIRKGWLSATRGVKQGRGGRGPWLVRRKDVALFRLRKPGLVGWGERRRRKARAA